MSKWVRRLPDPTPTAWFRRAWGRKDPEEWVKGDLGVEVYGLDDGTAPEPHRAAASSLRSAGMGAPDLIAIDHDDHHAEHVGRTADGRQFFLTTPFELGGPGQGGDEFVALYLFDAASGLLEARIDRFGPRSAVDREHRRALYEARLRELGEVSFTRIEVAPFALDRFGTTFGLLARPGEDEDDPWWVELHPGNYMAFTEPWDSGEYDT